MTEDSAIPSVTFCITELDIGGAEKAMVRIAIGLQDKGWRVRVISLRDAGAMIQQLQATGIPVTALGCRGFADIRAFWRLAAEFRTNPTDVVQCFLHQANFYGRLAARCIGLSGQPRPLMVSGVRVADRRTWVVLTDRLTRFCSDHYVAVSQHVAETHTKLCRLKPDAVSMIPNGVDVPGLSMQAPEPKRAVLLAVGRLTAQKAPFDLLEAYRLLPDAVRGNCQLKFVGEGPLASSLQRAIDQNQLRDRVQLLGYRHDISELMRQSTMLVLPSRWEGMPNVVLEAMANALPVVATSVDGTREVIDDGRTGWLVPPASPVDLAERIDMVLHDSEARNTVSRNAQVFVMKHFRWQSVIESYDQVLRDLRAGEAPTGTPRT